MLSSIAGLYITLISLSIVYENWGAISIHLIDLDAYGRTQKWVLDKKAPSERDQNEWLKKYDGKICKY